MLSGEAHENGEKTATGLISKKTILKVQHTFLYISLPLFCTTTTWNFQKLPGYTFFGGKVVLVFVHFFFFTSLIAPWWTQAFLIFLPPLQNFMLFLQQKMSPLFFPSRSSSFSRWASLACRPTFPAGEHSHTLPIRVCAAQRGRDFEAPDLERGIHFRGVF